jgi:reversibly glycosylated polypeptide/UDP-arabinopyranose mutase
VNVLVVPTNRPERLLEFLDAWDPWPWDRILIIEDGDALTLDLPADRWSSDLSRVETYSWADIDAELSEPQIISRRDSGIRAFGFWKAWERGATCVFTLDDDCHPAGDQIVAGHLRNLYETPLWQSTVPGLRVRGLPYRNQGRALDVDVSVGLWLGYPDLDAVQSLAHESLGATANLVSAVHSRVMPSEQYFPMSGMNLAVRREAACLMYCPPMGAHSPYGRFDDIWCGLVVQRICRHLRRSIVCGRPFVEHRRASDPFANLLKEAAGVGANEGMWEVIDALELRERTPLGCMREVGGGLLARANDDYMEVWGRSILAWCDLFDEAER